MFTIFLMTISSVTHVSHGTTVYVQDMGSKHPVILLPSDIGLPELRAMVEFMYTGQVSTYGALFICSFV